MPTADCPTVELQRREVFGKAFTVDIVVVVSRTQCRSISRYFKSHGRIRLNLSQSDSLPDSLASHLQVTCLSCLRQSYHSRRRGWRRAWRRSCGRWSWWSWLFDGRRRRHVRRRRHRGRAHLTNQSSRAHEGIHHPQRLQATAFTHGYQMTPDTRAQECQNMSE